VWVSVVPVLHLTVDVSALMDRLCRARLSGLLSYKDLAVL
jgi:hypothetical protein